jgi:hypothetical protein
VGVIRFTVFSFSISRWTNLHNQSCVASTILWWNIKRKLEWRSNLPWLSYGCWKCMLVDFLIEHIGMYDY